MTALDSNSTGERSAGDVVSKIAYNLKALAGCTSISSSTAKEIQANLSKCKPNELQFELQLVAHFKQFFCQSGSEAGGDRQIVEKLAKDLEQLQKEQARRSGQQDKEAEQLRKNLEKQLESVLHAETDKGNVSTWRKKAKKTLKLDQEQWCVALRSTFDAISGAAKSSSGKQENAPGN